MRFGRLRGLSPRAYFGLAVFFAGLAVYYLASGIYWLSSGLASETWPAAAGQVTASSVERRTHRPGGGGTMRGMSRTYAPIIRYRYETGGQNFTGQRLSFGKVRKEYSEKSEAERAAGHYRVGDPVSVYFNPKHPERSVLVPGASAYLFYFFTAAGSCTVSVILFLKSRRKRRGK